MIAIVASVKDNLALQLTQAWQQSGIAVTHLDLHDASTYFTTRIDGHNSEVSPRLPVLFRSMTLPTPTTFDEEFCQGEAVAAVWAALALQSAPVVNRPSKTGFNARVTASSYVTERRAGLAARHEMYSRQFEDIAPTAHPFWVGDVVTGATSEYPQKPQGCGPFRGRPGYLAPGYEEVIVVARRAWRRSTAALDALQLEATSIAAVQALGLDFAAVGWLISADLNDASPVYINASPNSQQCASHFAEISAALLEVLLP